MGFQDLLSVERILQKWSNKHIREREHFDDLKEFVIEPYLNKLGRGTYGIERREINESLLKDIKENHYPKLKKLSEEGEELEADRSDAFNDYFEGLKEYAKRKAGELDIDWFQPEKNPYARAVSLTIAGIVSKSIFLHARYLLCPTTSSYFSFFFHNCNRIK